MLFDEDSQPSAAPSEFDLSIADRLRVIVLRVKFIRQWSRKKWANEVRLLRGDIGEEAELKISHVVSYLELAKDSNIQATSAQWFRRNFFWLEQRAKQDSVAPLPPISATEQRVFDLLERLSWPEHATGYESFVRQSYANALRLYRQLGGIEEQDSTTFAAYVFTRLPDLEEFIVEWVEGVHRQIWGWDGWSGKLKLMSFKVAHRKFQEWGRKLSREYDGSYGEWDKLMKELGYD